jgi:hypothetical protein
MPRFPFFNAARLCCRNEFSDVPSIVRNRPPRDT